jgi:uncharacterized protein YdeI (YjbR/CyaY-like superfamily)
LKPAQARGFAGPAEFRAWLARNHATAAELYVRCAKARARAGLTYRQALDEALCIGWIDGVRNGLDATSFSVRFTPRKPRSAWSAVNIKRFRELQALGLVRPPGREAFEAGVKSEYSFESRPRALAPAYLRRFHAERQAWAFFEAQPPWYRRTCSFWVMSAKKPETRKRRLEVLIAHSQRREGIPPLRRPSGRKGGPRPEVARDRDAPRTRVRSGELRGGRR